MRDRTRMREQPALTTSAGRGWLVMGGLLALVCVAVLAILLTRTIVPGIAIVGIVLAIVCYAVIVAARLLIGYGRKRLIVMAIAMGCMAAATLVCVIVIGQLESLSTTRP